MADASSFLFALSKSWSASLRAASSCVAVSHFACNSIEAWKKSSMVRSSAHSRISWMAAI
eukprot:7982985-Prorocentrum_lima.AAC.1